MVIWLIGLSGAGKTTIGRFLYDQWKSKESNTVLVDGDEIRKIFKHDVGGDAYTIEGRRQNADRICEICAWLDRQNINVVCCILSLFEESRRWNRENYSKYFEVYISVPMDVLKRRQNNGLYTRALSGDMKNVVGVDIPFTPPEMPDYVFDNSSDDVDLKSVALDILNKSKKG
ncbi:MAG: adenylyl-sulfate kinase [Candidatus Scalindua sp.]